MANSLKINESLVHEEVEGELVIVDTESGKYFSLNSLAAEIFLGLEQEHSIEQIRERITSRFPDKAGEINADISELLEDFKRQEILVSKQSSGSSARNS